MDVPEDPSFKKSRPIPLYAQLLGGIAANDITDISEKVDKLFLGCEPSD